MKSGTGAVLVGAIALGLVAAPSAYAGGSPERWCTSVAPPCVESAERGSSTVTSGDPAWAIDTFPDGPGSESDGFQWVVRDRDAPSDPYDLGAGALGDEWVITWQTGAVAPRVAGVTGDAVTVSRADLPGPGGHKITVSGTPTLTTNNDNCNPGVLPWFCPMVPSPSDGGDVHAERNYLGGDVTDYGEWRNGPQRRSMYGLDLATNIALTSLPPEIVNDPASGEEQLLVRLANHHFREDGTTVFEGEAHLRIPNAFLTTTYGIDDPASLTSAGLDPTGTGGATVSVLPVGTAMQVDIEGLTFSQRRVKIGRGKVTPRRPRDVVARRTAQRRARVTFDEAVSRGSKVRRHSARCKSARGRRDVEVVRKKRSPLVVRGLRPSTRYKCKVRGLSRAGGGAAASVTVRAKPQS